MNKSEMDRLRSSTLYDDEILKVKYTGKSANFPKNIAIKAIPKFKRRTDLPYPQPKWVACNYYIEDLDGDSFLVAKDRYGELHVGFEWLEN